MPAVARVDPQGMLVGVDAVAAVGLERLAAVAGAVQGDAAGRRRYLSSLGSTRTWLKYIGRGLRLLMRVQIRRRRSTCRRRRTRGRPGPAGPARSRAGRRSQKLYGRVRGRLPPAGRRATVSVELLALLAAQDVQRAPCRPACRRGAARPAAGSWSTSVLSIVSITSPTFRPAFSAAPCRHDARHADAALRHPRRGNRRGSRRPPPGRCRLPGACPASPRLPASPCRAAPSASACRRPCAADARRSAPRSS